jgi:peroxiredoxin
MFASQRFKLVPERLFRNQLGIMTGPQEYRGQHVLLWWMDSFPGPDAAKNWDWLRDSYLEFAARNVAMFAISSETTVVNRAFADRLHITFDVLSDPDRFLAGVAFGVSRKFNDAGMCLIDPEGRIVKCSVGAQISNDMSRLIAYLGGRRLIGDRIPTVNVHQLVDGDQLTFRADQLFSGKKVVLFAVPGAFTPTCTAEHLPGYVRQSETIRKKGVEEIICLSVNDPFVMEAWGKKQAVEGKVSMVSDGSGRFSRAMGLEIDLRTAGFGLRSKRYAMIVDDGEIVHLNVEDGLGLETSDASTMLDLL